MKKIILSLACCSLMFATNASNDYAKNRAGITEGSDVIDTREAVKGNREKTIDDTQDNTFAVIYNHIQEYEIKHAKDGAVLQATGFAGNDIQSGSRYDFYAEHQERIAQRQAQAQAEASKLTEAISLFTNGYCVLQNKVSIGRLAGYADLSCDLSIDKRAVLKVALTPDFYTYSLIATPLYAIIDGKRFTVNGGAVTNGLRTSINVATRVDDFLIGRIIADTGVKSANVMTQYAQEWIDERKSYRESRNNQSNTTYTMNGSSTIVTQSSANNNVPPKYQDYLGGALVEVVGSLMTSIGNAYLQTREFAFEIDAKTILYVDLEFDTTRQALRGIGFVPDNMAVQQPSTNFDDSDPTGGINYNNINIGNLDYKESAGGRQMGQSVARKNELEINVAPPLNNKVNTPRNRTNIYYNTNGIVPPPATNGYAR